MGSSHFSSGFLPDLPMEINLAFYPPPTVIIPEIKIPKLKKYEYKFDRERAAIRRYSEEQTRLRLEAERKEEELKKNKKQEFERAEEITNKIADKNKREFECAEGITNTIADKNKREFECAEEITKTMADVELRPTSSDDRPAPLQAHQNHEQKQKYTLKGLEEFEMKRDLFDLMELRSLDDRKELEKLLMNPNIKF